MNTTYSQLCYLTRQAELLWPMPKYLKKKNHYSVLLIYYNPIEPKNKAKIK